MSRKRVLRERIHHILQLQITFHLSLQQRVCLFLVNTTGERVTIHLDVNKSGGNVTSGWRRRLVPDAEKGAMRNSTRERSGKPFAETVEPGEITFMDFRI